LFLILPPLNLRLSRLVRTIDAQPKNFICMSAPLMPSAYISRRPDCLVAINPMKKDLPMADKKDIHVVPHDDGWATRREGAGRAGVVTETQQAAIERAREQARRDKVEVVIHRKDGTIRDSDSYGNDPYPPKDKKH
jgi:hypothetical protein